MRASSDENSDDLIFRSLSNQDGSQSNYKGNLGRANVTKSFRWLFSAPLLSTFSTVSARSGYSVLARSVARATRF